MKNLFFSLMLLSISYGLSAAVFIVDNSIENPGNLPDYASAEALASDGDTIYLTPTNLSYGTLEIEKRLTVIGNGNSNPTFQGYTIVQNLQFKHDSTVVSGLYITEDVTIGINSNTTNQRFKCELANCFVTDEVKIHGGNHLIRNNIIMGAINGNTNADGSQLSNNIINAGMISVDNCTFSNNLFYRRSATSYFWNNVDNNIILSNVILMYDNVGWFSTSSTGNVYNNNLTYNPLATITNAANTLPPSGNSGFGNINDVDPQFNDFPADTALINGIWNYEWDLGYANNSPLVGAGEGGKDIGIFGGTYPMDPEWFMYAHIGPVMLNFEVNGGNPNLPTNSFVPVNAKAINTFGN